MACVVFVVVVFVVVVVKTIKKNKCDVSCSSIV